MKEISEKLNLLTQTNLRKQFIIIKKMHINVHC